MQELQKVNLEKRLSQIDKAKNKKTTTLKPIDAVANKEKQATFIPQHDREFKTSDQTRQTTSRIECADVGNRQCHRKPFSHFEEQGFRFLGVSNDGKPKRGQCWKIRKRDKTN